MLVLMFVTFFTSRIVLSSLGVVDFGINNVVGGMALMFVFFRSSLANVTQRDLNIEIGRKNKEQTLYVFRLHQSIYIVIAIVVAVLAETIGLWFVENKLVIPSERMDSALWVYHFTVASLCMTIVSVVYDSVLIAHEDMKIYSYVGIVEGFAKLLIAYIIVFIPFDRLSTYGFLLFVLAIGLRFFYAYYCSKHYEECKYSFIWNKSDVKRTISFIGWNTIGCLVYIMNEQGINMMLNMFFGPAINAARAISYQVSGGIGNFTSNFYTAVRPQMTKLYAIGDYGKLENLFFLSSKFSIYLIWVFVLPVMFCIDPILKFWLGTVPNYTNVFTQLVLVYAVVNTLNNPIWSLALSIGKLKGYILYGNAVYFLAFPISFIFLKCGYSPVSVFTVLIIVRMLYIFVVLKIVCKYVNYSVWKYWKSVILPCIFVIFVSFSLCDLLITQINQDFVGIVSFIALSVIINCSIVYLIGLSKAERNKVKLFVNNRLLKRNAYE